MRTLLLAGLVLAGCTQDKVSVECQGGGGGITCTMKHAEGSGLVNACFDVVVACRAGGSAKAHGCQVLEPVQTASKLLQDADFAGLDKCEPNGMTVSNVTVTKQ